ncbi:hydroxymethylpyrimidine/phosphomethylpyrimidine kinase [Streptohalobacillus salinus]|uniref:Hydroxymethylpyrimidine/phosphomethylpyrimidine kinase n=1 Tax=Streptohalobacillus salinus TaxID=621096 RepID=A0A2V3W544_9BACI|nr:bifunctional hydroxymethylpyrimidine kinase/phosphomethylpyrimidine kinase [Streptohalobacillus salinus]PXW89222.1 hydroxymethylpyrimidine/phosphomethylpyrimidine kinase [Streptohalobacillus salinus]
MNTNAKVCPVLTIAGTDPSGGAGIQADLKTFQERYVYGMSVVTSVVAQNTTGVTAVHHLPVTFIDQQLEAVFSDIVPYAIKTGMIASKEMMASVLRYLKRFPELPFVLDPVMVATSGDVLMEEHARDFLVNQLLARATVVTPNIKEAELMLDQTIETTTAMEKAAERLVDVYGAKAAVIKGGHLGETCIDVLYDGKMMTHLESERIDTEATHGTGCTFAAAITAELAKGKTILEAVQLAKLFVTDAIRYQLLLGKGHGPTNHWGYRLKSVPLDVQEVSFDGND